MKQSLDELARRWRERGAPAAASRCLPLATLRRRVADAFAVQDRMAEILGERAVGWKVGAAVRAVQILEGHDGPIVGRLLASRVFASPAQVPWALFDGCKIESEFAFRFREAVPARDRARTRDELGPAARVPSRTRDRGVALRARQRRAQAHDARRHRRQWCRRRRTSSARASPTGGASTSNTCLSTRASTVACRSTLMPANSAAIPSTSWSRPSTGWPRAASGSPQAICFPPARSRSRRCCSCGQTYAARFGDIATLSVTAA